MFQKILKCVFVGEREFQGVSEALLEVFGILGGVAEVCYWGLRRLRSIKWVSVALNEFQGIQGSFRGISGRISRFSASTTHGRY